MKKKFGKFITIELCGSKIRLLALAVAVFMLIFVIHFMDLYFDSTLEDSSKQVLFILSLLASPFAAFLIAFRIKAKKRYEVLLNTILFFIMPIFTLQMVECFNGNFIYNFSVPTFILNYMLYLFFYLLFYLFTARYHMTGLIINISLYVFGIINYFVDSFRGTPFVPMDILTIKTGMSVAGGYTYSISWELILASILFFLIYLVNKKIVNVRPHGMKYKLFARGLSSGYLVVILLGFFSTSFLAYNGYKPDFWDQDRGYRNTGSFFNFCLNIKYLIVEKPKSYNAADTEGLVNNLLSQYGVSENGSVSTDILSGENTYKASTSSTTPNIICIMNESFSDLGTLGDLETNEDYMPFIHSLTKNTIKGTLYVPVFGAGTSNTEFEFLTGNSISFLPAGCNVYQSYIDTKIPSLVSTLSSLGFSEQAFHPYYGDGWNRENVYNDLGFSKFTSIEDFVDSDILSSYKKSNDSIAFQNMLSVRYPGQNMLLRRFISDSYDFKMLEKMYTSRNKSKPFFLFNVTMQNHGGYDVAYSNFDQQIYVTNMSQTYPEADRYLSLIKKTDTAFKQLVEYFSKVKEPTIICMYGDHQPYLEDSFYEELFGTDLDDLTTQQSQSRFTTPFIIWANYDIPEKTIQKMSANYLSTLVLQVAGEKMTDYNKYLAALYQKLPVIDSLGYIDSNNKYYSYTDESQYSSLINDYQRIEYNNLIDTDNTVTSQFYLSDK